ncbi:MAG TPA: proline--tRNA ligase [Candidatus Thermoplasmatota archaeon]|nr:proline--tRNA ligase [Candidatus Thermoplasmatota archaeon]
MPATAVPKSKDFMEWYNEVVEVAELTDKRYPIKGMNIWRPYGQRIMNRIDSFTREEMERTHHDEVAFPLMIPEKLFMKEADQIKGFGSEVFWVTHAGDNALPDGERWVVRPTSECAMYEIFPLWIRSHSDLPLQTFQVCNVFRYETKQTRAFMRVREIHFFEDHSVFKDEATAREHVELDLAIVRNVYQKLALPALYSRRPDWDKFPGAVDSTGADVVMPSGRTLQCATVHYYGENFARAYGMKYESESEGHKFCHQTTYGMSERLVGAIVGCHGDDNGLILPPEIAPFQVVIVPVIFKDGGEAVMAACRQVQERLKAAGLRVELDDRQKTSGEKYYHWELRGVPLRLEIGPKDVEKKSVFAARRDMGKEGKKAIPMDNLETGVRETLAAIQTALLERQAAFVATRVKQPATLDEAKKLDAEAQKSGVGYILAMPICSDACAAQVEKGLDIKTLGVPAGMDKLQNMGGTCAVCGKAAKDTLRFARTY